MKKILFLRRQMDGFGGIQRVSVDVAGLLKKKGYDVYFLAYYKNMSKEESFDYSEFKVFYLSEKLFDLRYSFLKAGKLRKTVNKINPDFIIYVDSVLYLPLHPFIPKKYKQIVWEHFNYMTTFGTRLRIWSRKYAAATADACVLLSEADAAMWRKNCRCRAEIKVIPNPVRGDVLAASREREREERLISERKKQVLFVGRLARQKQVPELIEIWSMVEKNHPQWELVIVGDGDERPLVEERIRKHDLQRVRLIGKTPDVSEYYKDSRIFVFTSAFEGFGLVLIEGLCFGLPEVSFDCPCGPDEIIEDGKNGFVIKDFNKALFAQKLAELMENERMQEEFSHRSKELSRKYLPENILPQWEALFEELSSFTSTKGI